MPTYTLVTITTAITDIIVIMAIMATTDTVGIMVTDTAIIEQLNVSGLPFG